MLDELNGYLAVNYASYGLSQQIPGLCREIFARVSMFPMICPARLDKYGILMLRLGYEYSVDVAVGDKAIAISVQLVE